jgi:hypothetical protein
MAALARTAGAPGLTRRRVLVGSGVLAAAAVSTALPGLVRPAAAQERRGLRAATFRSAVGGAFVFAARRSGRVRLRLEAVEGVGTAAATESTFVLRFAGPAARHQGGEVGTLRAPGLPASRLLVVPSGRAHAAGQDWVATVVGADLR